MTQLTVVSEDTFLGELAQKGIRLNAQQLQVVQTDTFPLLVLAVPGSGKTTTLIASIGHYVKVRGIAPQRILAVTFSRASAHDMKERGQRVFPDLSFQNVFSTIHSLSYRILMDAMRLKERRTVLIEGQGEGGNDTPVLATYGNVAIKNKRQLIKYMMKEVRGSFPKDEEVDDVIGRLTYVKNRLWTDDEIATKDHGIEHFSKIYTAYETLKKRENEDWIDYDDMLVGAWRALQDETLRMPDGRTLLAHYQGLYDVILTDESQDTSLVQHEIIAQLAAPHQRLLMVGDGDQSIYEWRGADVQYLLDFKKRYPQATVIKMETNYRSTPDIIQPASQFIRRNRNRYDVTMNTPNPSVGKPIQVRRFYQHTEQMWSVVKEIRRLHEEGVPFREMAILFRENASALDAVYTLFHQQIPFYVKEDIPFATHWVTKELMKLLTLGQQIAEGDVQLTLFAETAPRLNAYINKEQAQSVVKEMGRGQDPFDVWMSRRSAPEYQKKRLATAKRILARTTHLRPAAGISLLRDELDFDKSIGAKGSPSMSDNTSEQLLSLLDALQSFAERYDTFGDFQAGLDEFSRLIRNSKQTKGQAVELLTLHSSKGLEYEAVFMIDLIQDVFPRKEEVDEYRKGNVTRLEESTRLFYVGMTRAKRELFLYAYTERGGKTKMPSMFVKDVERILAGQFQATTLPEDTQQPASKKRTTSKATRFNPHLVREDIVEGISMAHKTFGPGTIEKVTDQQVWFRTKTGTLKKLDLTLVVQNGMLQPIE